MASSTITKIIAPLNLKLLNLRSKRDVLRMLPRITSQDIYETANSTNFHSEGLFSTEFFGRVGDPRRDTQFAWIDLRATILHPATFDRVVQVKGLYGEIMAGKAYAVWDDKTKEFVASDELEGDTGYHFFISHWKDIVFPKSEESVNKTPGEQDLTTLRNQRIAAIDRYRDVALIDTIPVLPAGLRDIEIDDVGRVNEGELNPMYRSVLRIVNTISDSYDKNNAALDNARMVLQLEVNAIHQYWLDLLFGKTGYLQSKWASRKIVNGTRNVISAMNAIVHDLDDDESVGSNDTIVGLWQVSRGCLPITRPAIRRFLVDDVFSSADGMIQLIDKKTLKLVTVQPTPKAFDAWTTNTGLEKLINSQSVFELRSRPILVDDYYLALVYRPRRSNVFKVFRDITTLPEGFSKEDVYPITLMELIYLCNYQHWNKVKVFITRYPITGEGSIYPSNVRVATTTRSEKRYELDDDWVSYKYPDTPASAFPDFEEGKYIDTTMVHPFRVAGLGADYDGDQTSNNFIYTQEGIDEINAYLSTANAYIDPAGGFRSSVATDVLALVLRNSTTL